MGLMRRGHGAGLFFGRDQILPHFDQHMRQTVHRAMGVHAIVFEFAAIRLVVADRETRARETREQRPREPVIAIPQDADFPRTRHIFPCGREAVHRDQRGNSALLALARDFGFDGCVIGRVKIRDAFGHFIRTRARIAGNDAAI